VKAPSQVISISMGGLPSWTLWKAVRYARDQGDVVVAAAGNNVGFVVWPARFRETVAVAATNVDCGVWKGSSHGDAVDIAAPGESVWHAEVDPAGGNIVDMGSGTTYATAAVAGIAALWLDQHRSEPLLRQLQKDGQVTDAFRSALRASAWIPPATSVPQNVTCLDRSAWNANETGAGIADAAKTLAQPLARPAAARALDGGRLPLFRSVFPSTVPYEEIEDRYRRLLRVGPETSTESVSDLEAEIVQNYALNESVRQSLDAIAQDAPPSGDQLQAVRAALLQASISNRLRQALT
jgi:subtilisin family serine protease